MDVNRGDLRSAMPMGGRFTMSRCMVGWSVVLWLGAHTVCPALLVTNDITANTTWTLGDSPVVVSNYALVVDTNATLTIDPGVTVKVKGTLTVKGQLKALGTATDRIVFDELDAGAGWGFLNFTLAAFPEYRTNECYYADLRNMRSYIYISQQTVLFSNCTLSITGNFSYGMGAYVNTNSGNPARLALVSNTVTITTTRDSAGSMLYPVIIDGMPCELVNNVFTLTATGQSATCRGIQLYRSNTAPFEGRITGNTITVSNTPDYASETYGVYQATSINSPFSNNTVTVVSPAGAYGLYKMDDGVIVNNRFTVSSVHNAGFGYVYGIYSPNASLGETDLIVNNRVHVGSDAPDRNLYGLYCQAGRARGNRIVLNRSVSNGNLYGIYQIYYAGFIENNSVLLNGVADLPAKGLYISSHYNPAAVVTVRNNIFAYGGAASVNAAGFYVGGDNTAIVSNDYNLIYGFASNVAGIAAGPADVTADPQLADTNLHLSASSPAINAGTNQAWMADATDGEGDPRLAGGRVDIGADEYLSNTVSVTFSSAAPNPTRDSPIPVTVRFGENVAGFTNTDLAPGNAVISNFLTVSPSNYTFDLYPTNQGGVTVDLPSGAAQGVASSNLTAAAVQFTRGFDSLGPTGVIARLSASPTNAASMPFAVTFNESVTGLTSNEVTLINSGTATGAVPPALAGSGTNYTVTLNGVTGDGWLGVRVDAGVCVDAAGNTNLALAAISNQMDQTRPTCVIARTGATPTNLATVGFTLTFNEPVTGLLLSGLTLTNAGGASGVPTNLTGGGAGYTVEVANVTGDGEIGLLLAESNAWDTAGNGNQAGARVAYAIDRTQPVCTIARLGANPTNASTVGFSIVFDEAVSGFTVADVMLTNAGTAAGALANFAGSGSGYTVDVVTVTGDGEIGIQVAESNAWDAVGNGHQAGARVAYTIDRTRPACTIVRLAATPSGSNVLGFGLTFGESVGGFGLGGITLTNAGTATGTLANWSGAGNAYTVQVVSVGGEGEIGIAVAQDNAWDVAGNGNQAGARVAYQVDHTGPTPDPPTWSLAPTALGVTAIRMTATTATDSNAPVQYRFANLTAGADSGWQAEPGWTNVGLGVNASYRYRLKARDAVGNETAWSVTNSACTWANTPLTPALTMAGPTACRVVLNAALTGGVYNADGNPSNTQYAVGLVTNTTGTNYLTLSGDIAGGAVWGTFSDWGGAAGFTAMNLNNLLTNAIIVKARNQNGVETGFGPAMNVVWYLQVGLTNALQAGDGSGRVTVTAPFANPWTNASRLRVTYGLNAGGSAGATNPAWLTSATAAYGAVAVTNGASHQIVAVSAAAYTNTVTFVWDTQAGGQSPALTNLDTNIWLGVHLYDPIRDVTSTTVWTSLRVDNRRPGVTLVSASADSTATSPIPVTATFSESVADFAASDLSVANATVGAFVTNSASIYTFDLIPLAQGTVTVALVSDVARDAFGNGNTAAAFSRVYAALSAPVGVSASDGSFTDQVQVTWSAVTGATGYEVWRHTANNTATAARLANAIDTHYDDTGAAVGTLYYYWIKATNSAGRSAFSSTDSGYRGAAGSTFTNSTGDTTNDSEWSVPTNVVENTCVFNDFDGDGRSDYVVYQAASGFWYVWQSSRGLVYGQFGGPSYAATTGDFDGDAACDPAVCEAGSGAWLAWLSGQQAVGSASFPYIGLTPVRGDFDGDGLDDPAVYQEASGYWYFQMSGEQDLFTTETQSALRPGAETQDSQRALRLRGEQSTISNQKSTMSIWFGASGYVPVPGDYDGDGATDLAVYHEASGYWFVRPMATGAWYGQWFGAPGYTPVSGDYDGDGWTDMAVYQEASGNWFVLPSASGAWYAQGLGAAGCAPVPGDYDGDGKTDMAVYQETSGYWYVRRSSDSAVGAQWFGGVGYAPVK